MAMLLRGSLRSFGSQLRVGAQRSVGVRRMCTAVAEAAAEEAPASPFAASVPHNAQFYATCFISYLFALKWQAADRSLAKEIAAHKEAHPEAHAEPAAAAAAPAATPAAPVSAVTAAVVAAPAGAAPSTWKVADVAGWLESIELGMHAESFKTHSVNGKMLLALSDQDLYATLGVVSPLHRKKLLMEISALRKSYLSK